MAASRESEFERSYDGCSWPDHLLEYTVACSKPRTSGYLINKNISFAARFHLRTFLGAFVISCQAEREYAQ